MNTCKICGAEFASERSLHAHLKTHKVMIAEYYTKYYPRYNLYNGDPLPFKKKDEYFSKDFSTHSQLLKWCAREPSDIVKPYILELLKRRIEQKELKFGPSYLELKLHELPTIEIYKKHFGSYTAACQEAGVKPMYGSPLPDIWKNKIDDVEIFIDTREQQPLAFPKSQSLKLDFGDYAVGQDHYDYTYVDRKGEQDFKSTLSKNNLERFEYELQRTKEFDSYLFIVTESPIWQIKKNNRWGAHKSNLNYIYHNMRVLNHKFSGHCQFIFTKDREHSQKIIPKLLVLGRKLWNVDLQYYIDKDIV